MDIKIREQANQITRPADGHGNRTDRIFQNEIPADDPCNKLADRGVGVGIGTAGDRHGRRHLRIAKSGEGTRNAGQDKRQRDRRTGIGRRRMSRENENAGAHDAADTKRNEIKRR